MSKDPVARPIQDSRELVVAHSAESSRTAPLRKPALLLGLYEFLLRAALCRCRVLTRPALSWEFFFLTLLLRSPPSCVNSLSFLCFWLAVFSSFAPPSPASCSSSHTRPFPPLS